jgi:GTPase SAR1 family protein
MDTTKRFSPINIRGVECKLDAASPSIALLPCEIRHGTFDDALKFVNDMQRGYKPSYHNKILFVGHQAVGKTSLLNNLFPLAAIFTDERSGAQLEMHVALQGPFLVLSQGNNPCQVIELSEKMQTKRVGVSALSFSVTPLRSKDKLEPIRLAFKAESTPIVESVRQMSGASHLVAITLQFPDLKSCDKWFQLISHWTHNYPTSGIDTRSHVADYNDQNTMLLRFMDFAGQEEFAVLGFEIMYYLFLYQ